MDPDLCGIPSSCLAPREHHSITYPYARWNGKPSWPRGCQRCRLFGTPPGLGQWSSSVVVPGDADKIVADNVTRMHGVVGVGPNGRPGWIPEPLTPNTTALPMAQILRKGGGFNLFLSNALPLDRDVPDIRPSACKAVTYDTTAPGFSTLSVIIVFYNEPFSTLFRSVHSVLNRTPPILLREIILVDDGSDLEWIRTRGGQLEKYIALLPKTRLVRNPQRGGIVPARMLGIRAATAPVFVILDSHIEVNPGWAEPLLHRIHQNPRSIVMPSIASVNPETFEPGGGGIGCTLGFCGN